MKPTMNLKMLNNNKGLIIGLLAFLIVLVFTDLDPDNPAITYTLAVALLMAIWWMTEAVPLAVTSLLPVALFPLLGIMDGRNVVVTSKCIINHLPSPQRCGTESQKRAYAEMKAREITNLIHGTK